MAITKLNPNTIHLAGPKVLVNDLATGVAATPGMIAEMYDDAGTTKWRPHASADEQATLAVYLEQDEMNKTIDDDYAIGDLAKVAFLAAGSMFYTLIVSGQDIANGDLLQSNGDGWLKDATATTADANLARFQSLTNAGAVVANTRIRVQVIG